MKSIRVKLWAGLMVLVAVMLILLWLFQIVFLESFYTRMRISEIKSTGYSIIEEMDQISQPGIQPGIEDRLDALSYNNNLNIELLDGKGNTVYESAAGAGGNAPMMRNNVRYQALGEVLANKEASISLTHPRFGNKFMLIGLPVNISGTTQGALFINMPLAPVEETVSILKKQLIYITLILLIAASVFSVLISKTFTGPILKIKRVSEKMAAGDFSDRLEFKSRDEIGQLAKTINFMGQELAKIEQLRKDLIANVSHELRTPLSLIRGYAETIRDVSGNVPAKREKQLEVIIEESDRLSKIVDDMLNLSQMQAGYFKLKTGSFSLNNLVDRVVEKYGILSETTGVTVQTKRTGEFTVRADESRIEQVLCNLINNAFNHTGAGGKISVNLSDDDKSVRVEIIDTGTGIPEEKIKNIWDRYYRADKPGEKRMVGTGLGLAIVKSILEAHKARYGVMSKEETGTTFWFELNK
ncbi:MAG: hypothetical protein CVU89_00285 [Firmicutes bacterium HGW-Firmicutes-14]|nr:MAG: hypothetical protein CVU89_00285 [Firmicutes bacterium HGW-Firmicutes-14]